MKKRAIILRSILIFAVVLFVSVSLWAIFHSHLCTDTNCPLCRLSDGKKLGTVPLLSEFYLLIPTVLAVGAAADNGRILRLTPIKEGVKLNS